MKLLRMTATFGRLDHETLTLTDGLNLLQLPNEAGKSTWAEFLLAMFYGVDTSEREKTGVLPVKTKYQPWNGKAMEGTIELDQDGRRITLTRTSAARAPMSVFSAVYTDSGLPVEGLTGANCGERLLGVPKSVYQRSAFVRQAGLGLTPDESLESRLSALVTTATRPSATPPRTSGCRRGRTASSITRRASSRTPSGACRRGGESADARGASIRKIWSCTRSCSSCSCRRNAARRSCGRGGRRGAAEAQAPLRREARRPAGVEPRKRRRRAVRPAPAGGDASDPLAGGCGPAAIPGAGKTGPAPEKPACPPAFAGVDEERLMEKAQHDMREFDRLTAKKYRSSALCWIFAIAGLALAAVGWFRLHEILICAAGALIALGCVGLALLHARHNRRREQELDQAQALLALYGNRSRDEFAVLAADTREAMRVWRAACSPRGGGRRFV